MSDECSDKEFDMHSETSFEDDFRPERQNKIQLFFDKAKAREKLKGQIELSTPIVAGMKKQKNEEHVEI